MDIYGETASTQLPDGYDKVAEPENDPVSHPRHYCNGSIECIDFIDSCGYGLDFCLANAIKYLTRCKLKGTTVQDIRCKLKGTTVQDIRKAIWYATHAADKLESGEYKV